MRADVAVLCVGADFWEKSSPNQSSRAMWQLLFVKAYPERQHLRNVTNCKFSITLKKMLDVSPYSVVLVLKCLSYCLLLTLRTLAGYNEGCQGRIVWQSLHPWEKKFGPYRTAGEAKKLHAHN